MKADLSRDPRKFPHVRAISSNKRTGENLLRERLLDYHTLFYRGFKPTWTNYTGRGEANVGASDPSSSANK